MELEIEGKTVKHIQYMHMYTIMISVITQLHAKSFM